MEEKIMVLFADDEVEDLIDDFKDLFPEFEFIPQSTLTPEAVLPKFDTNLANSLIMRALGKQSVVPKMTPQIRMYTGLR